MKRFWLVMLSLGLVLAFSASAMAVDVKFSGSFEASGLYLDKLSLDKNYGSGGTAFYFQTLKINTEFIVSPGLKLVTAFNALDRVWGGARTAPGTGSGGTADPTYDSRSLGTRAEAENIAMTFAYISYASPIGLFEVGYIHDNVWGTTFGDNDKNGHATGGILWTVPVGHGVIGAIIYKEADNSNYYNNTSGLVDSDNDRYVLFGMYNFTKNIEAGLLGSYERVATDKYITPTSGFLLNIYTLQPYFKAKVGPVALEGEFWYGFGKLRYEDGIAGADMDVSQWMAYLNAVADFGMFYVGGTFAYVSGEDASNHSTLTGGMLGGGSDFNPCLIMFNNDLTYWAGAIQGYGNTAMQSQLYSTASNSGMQNAIFGQLKAGVRPVAKLDIAASISYAVADKKYTQVGPNISPAYYAPTNDGVYGTEVDLTATYKITNNLSYMLGGAYWFVGDYFKGAVTANNDLNNDYMLINKLTLTF